MILVESYKETNLSPIPSRLQFFKVTTAQKLKVASKEESGSPESQGLAGFGRVLYGGEIFASSINLGLDYFPFNY